MTQQFQKIWILIGGIKTANEIKKEFTDCDLSQFVTSR
ncbi:hypothetical protein [uncultured Gammaproteobacteria bacterium]|nr:hypothetical protein BROOK1789C_852 [Bathymodiolus brooksi thiotrophic gill symbiont]CAC9552037.1 hypothetical protein [uncultured Gammaproteobacteria bacterium]CAC9559112.1 hypothetical protein [uncultured Gammaproteobacteria bacterium]CAC9607003.1 hypothetical protein [uncultured Gammaproteobacteria bacterium]CAC9611837.1 hypothetical protein [uncultured Gammaproteobacteria bacterium]